MHWTEKVQRTLGHKTNPFHFLHTPTFQNLKMGGEFGINERRKFIATRSDYCPYKADRRTPMIPHQATGRLPEVAGHGL